jgi:hypothetical protein
MARRLGRAATISRVNRYDADQTASVIVPVICPICASLSPIPSPAMIKAVHSVTSAS